MKIAYLTPLHPDKSGISDYAELIIPELGKVYDLDIYTNPSKIENKLIEKKFHVYPIKKFYEKHAEYDVCIYQAGNNTEFHKDIIEAYMKFGGILEMHDLAMPHYVAADTIGRNLPDEYLKIMEYCHGEIGRERAIAYFQGKKTSSWDSEPLKFMTNKHFIDRAQAVIVHSDFAKQIVHTINSEVPIGYVPLPAFRFVDNPKEYQDLCREKLHIEKNEFIIGSFGFATSSKRIKETILALSMIKKHGQSFKYYIVGKLLDKNIKSLIKECRIENNVIITGFVNDEEFYIYLGICDLVMSLRYPTMGESSGPLNKALGMGKKTVVTDVGTFADYPDDVVKKISYGEHEIEDIYNAIMENMQSTDEQKSEYILQYAKKNLSTEYAIECYKRLITQLCASDFEHNYIDVIIDDLMKMQITHNSYLDIVYNRIKKVLPIDYINTL